MIVAGMFAKGQDPGLEDETLVLATCPVRLPFPDEQVLHCSANIHAPHLQGMIRTLERNPVPPDMNLSRCPK